MALPTGLNRSRSSIVFLTDETTAGTIAGHPVAGERFGLTTPPVIGQAGNYTDTSEIGPELISVDRVLNYMDYSTFDFEYYAKPGGVTDTTVTISSVAGTSGQTEITMETTATLAVGETIVVSGNTDDSEVNGTFLVTAFTAGTPNSFTYDTENALSSTVSSTTGMSVTKRVLTLPEEATLLNRCLGGVKYMSTAHDGYTAGTNSTTNVTSAKATVAQYFLSNTIETFTVTSRQFTDDSVQMFTATGALPTSWSVSLAKDGPVTFTTGFQANRVYYTGTAELDLSTYTTIDAAITTSSTVQVLSPLRVASDTSAFAEDIAFFQTGAYGSRFKIKNNGSIIQDTNGDDAIFYVYSAISSTTDLIVIRPVVALGSNATLSSSAFLIPYAPEDCQTTSNIIDQRKVQVYISDETTGTGISYLPSTNTELFHADNTFDVTAVSFDFDRSITTPGLTEMTGEEFPPASYVINEPTVSGSVTLLLRPKDFQFMNSLRANPRRSLGVRIGDTAGSIIEMGAPSVFMEVPTPGDADGALQLDIPFTVVRGQECEDADKFFIRYR